VTERRKKHTHTHTREVSKDGGALDEHADAGNASGGGTVAQAAQLLDVVGGELLGSIS
jgi:hypothetical protein